MKSIIIVLVGFLLANGSNQLVQSFCDPPRLGSECVLCEETPCKCKQLALEENGERIPIKKLIQLFLKKINSKCLNPETCEKCRHCRHACPKTNIITNILREILNKASFETKQEECIRKMITELLDPSNCEENPCQIHCDTQVQQVLKAILKKANNCNCDSHTDSTPCRRKLYKYWFKVSKEAPQKECACEYQHQNCHFNEEKGVLSTVLSETEKSRCRTHKSELECSKHCKIYQKPNSFICPCYINNNCRSRSNNNMLTICADCANCQIVQENSKNSVTLFCGGCRAVNLPFVYFTKNGHPFRQDPERQSGLQIKIKFLQINDFRFGEEKLINTIYNPFRLKCNIPNKKKGRRCSKEKGS